MTDPQFDHQSITEASYVNIPVIALCNTDSPSRFVDVAIPCNNRGVQAIGTMWWMLAREVIHSLGGKVNLTSDPLRIQKPVYDEYSYPCHN